MSVIKRLLYSPTSSTEVLVPTTPETPTRGVNLPKIEMPHSMVTCSAGKHFGNSSMFPYTVAGTSEMLAYLRHSMKDGSAKAVIEGLSQSGDQYLEAIESLKARYDRPRLKRRFWKAS